MPRTRSGTLLRMTSPPAHAARVRHSPRRSGARRHAARHLHRHRRRARPRRRRRVLADPQQPGRAAARRALRESREAPRDGARGAARRRADKPRFDFYKILPGIEEPKVQRAAPPSRRPRRRRAVARAARRQGAAPPPPAPVAAPARQGRDSADPAPKGPKPGDRYWLQAGSFTAQSDAENLKARLALGGWEANVQEGTLPDKGASATACASARTTIPTSSRA